MKKLILLLVFLLSVCAVAETLPETVTDMPYTLLIGESVFDGLYTGEIADDLPNGAGVFTYAAEDASGWQYEGQWLNGLMHGEGKITRADGTIESGVFEEGFRMPDIAYIGNSNTKKFHYPSCNSVEKIKEEHIFPLTSFDEAVSLGYVPCKRCNP